MVQKKQNLFMSDDKLFNRLKNKSKNAPNNMDMFAPEKKTTKKETENQFNEDDDDHFVIESNQKMLTMDELNKMSKQENKSESWNDEVNLNKIKEERLKKKPRRRRR